MKNHTYQPILFLLYFFFIVHSIGNAGTPIKPHPENPHYFLFRDKPTVLIGSTEHYGAVLNMDFDYITYLNTIQDAGMNLTRTVNGTYCEGTTSEIWRGGDQNTLAPRDGKFLSPFARSEEPGYFGGGNKFDLFKWNESYFERLKDFVSEASMRGIVVEFNLFYIMYGDGTDDPYGAWAYCPFNAINNVNNIGNITYDRLISLTDLKLVERQKALVKKTLEVLNEFDNVYYEVCDEPYLSGASPSEVREWHDQIINTFVDAEKNLPNKHMIAVNFDNVYSVVENLNPAISILNFHYCSPPHVIDINYKHNRPIAFDETFEGHKTMNRRREAWAFLMNGGAVYNNLDISFATDDPTGSGKVRQKDGIYDCRELRFQLNVLHDFMKSINFIDMNPDRNIGYLFPYGGGHMILYNEGKEYAVYFTEGRRPTSTLMIDLPEGNYIPEWVNPRTGDIIVGDTIKHYGGAHKLETPAFKEDIAVRIKAVEK